MYTASATFSKALAKNGDIGVDVEEVPLDEWIFRTRGAGLSKVVAAVSQGLGNGTQINFLRLLTQNIQD